MLITSCDSQTNPPKTIEFNHLFLPKAESAWYGQGHLKENIQYGRKTDHTTFESGIASFDNYFITQKLFGNLTAQYDGFAYSNKTTKEFDPATINPTFNSLYELLSVSSNKGNYLIYKNSTELKKSISFSHPVRPTSITISNTGQTYLSILNGNPDPSAGKQFTKGDWLKVIFTGKDEQGKMTGSQEFYLADFRSSRPYAIQKWTNVDLSALGSVNQIDISFACSDTAVYDGKTYINTPAMLSIKKIQLQ